MSAKRFDNMEYCYIMFTEYFTFDALGWKTWTNIVKNIIFMRNDLITRNVFSLIRPILNEGQNFINLYLEKKHF